MNIYPYVYRLDNPVTGEFYIGYRCANKVPADQDLGHKYFTSSKFVKPRFHEFNYQIIAEFFDKDDAYEFEQQLIFESFKSSYSLNKYCGFNNKNQFKCISHSNDTKQRIKRKLIGRIISDETKQLMRKPKSEEARINISNSSYRRGKTFGKISDLTKQKIREALKGRVFSDEHKRKIGEKHKNKLVTPETRQKIREALKGRIVSEETKLAQSLYRKGKPKPKLVCRIKDKKEMDIANFIRWETKNHKSPRI